MRFEGKGLKEQETKKEKQEIKETNPEALTKLKIREEKKKGKE